MRHFLFVSGLVWLMLAPVLGKDGPPAGDAKQKIDPLRTYYGKASALFEFFRDADQKQPLKRIEQPVMKWANDDDWSGDVCVWTWNDLPEVIGCVLSGPT